MGNELFRAVTMGHLPDPATLINDDSQVKLKRTMHAWRNGQPPVIVTHDMQDDANDPILKHLRYRGLFNSGDDPVKIVYHPQFMSATSPLLPLDYEQFVRGCHMGIFPSYYEPWGYTPMECTALGIPNVSTDLSGFGAYVERHILTGQENGIYVLKRRQRSFEEATGELVNYLMEFVRLGRRQRIELRNKVERLSDRFDWSALVSHYRDAHELALDRVGAHYQGSVQVRLV
jgi:glycogen(starch) synthase